MRKLFSPLTPLFLLLLACVAAHAQPAPQPQWSERCRRAAMRYVHPSPDKKHLTVEEENEYEYRGMKQYLSVCGDSDDGYTRQIKQAVAGYEAAKSASSRQVEPKPPAPCDDAVRKELYGRFLNNYKGSPEQQLVAYKAADEYVCRCAEYDDVMLYLSTWIRKYARTDRAYPSLEAAAEAVAREVAALPHCRCDEMREQLLKSLRDSYGHEHSQQNHETVKKFLKICGDTRRPLDRYLGEWLTKYDKSVREFEEKQQKGEAPAKGPLKEQ